MSDKMMNHALTALRQLKKILEERAESIEKNEISFLSEKINEYLAETLNQRYITESKELRGYWHDIFETILSRHLASEVTRHLDLDLFYAFGKHLLPTADDADLEPRPLLHKYLDFFRYSNLLVRIKNQQEWEDLILRIIDRSHFTIHELLRQRNRYNPGKVIFRVLKSTGVDNYSWKQVAEYLHIYAKGLGTLITAGQDKADKIAFLMENSIQMILLDLACLSSGIVNIMIPANSVAEHIAFILNQTEATLILVSNEKQLAKVKEIKRNCVHLKTAILISGTSHESWVISHAKLIELGNQAGDEQIQQWRNNTKINELATIMYTSGTTGDPKGIIFSQRNLIYKRFCRAMALPEIGEMDRFLCYLPLYHTFGRWLEMLGSIFWGAQYIFMENPALSTMLDNMQRIKPTVFISIPKKWSELYEYIKTKINIEIEDRERIKELVKKISGGELKWGLSAAGFLEPEVFKFFQSVGIELMSGFGMTEATGGILMTPPGQYQDNSLGKPLPGIECKLAEDGELLIRGPYVMIGYYGLSEDQNPFSEGWFPTGDIMQKDKNGFYKIVDRKKEIYKNIKGETIAPQKIENLFKDFETVQQVFLVGDHKPFNTVLIFPNAAAESPNIKRMSPQEKENYFASVIVTVNKFLASFERIVDFRLIDRAFTTEKGEITPKNTYKRKVIEQNFAEMIELLYKKNYVSLFRNEIEVRIPSWFLRERGCLANDIQLDENQLLIKKYGHQLTLRQISQQNVFQIGDYLYRIENSPLDLQPILANPKYWLGNQALVDFCAEAVFQWYRLEDLDKNISFAGVVNYFRLPAEICEKQKLLLDQKEPSLWGLHLALRHIQSPDPDQAQLGLAYLKFLVDNDHHTFTNLVAEFIKRCSLTDQLTIQRELFKLGLTVFKASGFATLLTLYVERIPAFLQKDLIQHIVTVSRGEEYVAALHSVIKSEINRHRIRAEAANLIIPALFDLLAEFGIRHPTQYKRTRQLLVRYLLKKEGTISKAAHTSKSRLERGFRRWLGDTKDVAVDGETGVEYYWEDVITFEEGIAPAERTAILEVIKNTALLREAIFLFSEGRIVRLYDIPPGGIWISRLENQKHKTIYRLSVQTRYYGSYDMTLNSLKAKAQPFSIDEMNWLIHAGAPRRGLKLVEAFGGFWEKYGFWTQEYVPSETVAKFFQRTLRREKENAESRFFHFWPFIIWTAMAAHLSFWKRSEYQIELIDKSIHNIVVPQHDYQTGQRIVSIADRKKAKGFLPLIRDFYEQFILQTQSLYPFLSRDFICRFAFFAVLETMDEKLGLDLLKESLEEIRLKKEKCQEDDLPALLQKFIQTIESEGFIPKQLFFAIRRFHRWFDLNKDAELTAQALTINELSDTYQLDLLEKTFPETRTRFFLETVFAESSKDLRQSLLNIVLKQHNDKIPFESVMTMFSDVQKEFELNEKEKFFLSRLSYPHLKPTDSAILITTPVEGATQTDVVVRLDDYDGLPYWVRKPVTPKEISRLHQLFFDSNLPVFFRPEHRFLVAVSEREHVIGGLYYNFLDNHTVYMEKIVVSGHFRRKGISEGLMNEFFNRLKSEGVQRVTTGFFRPEYFYRFGFKVERKYAGLVKELGDLPLTPKN